MAVSYGLKLSLALLLEEMNTLEVSPGEGGAWALRPSLLRDCGAETLCMDSDTSDAQVRLEEDGSWDGSWDGNGEDVS